jgi:hypothetical protein
METISEETGKRKSQGAAGSHGSDAGSGSTGLHLSYDCQKARYHFPLSLPQPAGGGEEVVAVKDPSRQKKEITMVNDFF